jgi:hypothetical protein
MSDHQTILRIGKRIGEFLILGLYLAIDVVEIWHKSHFWTLVVAVIGGVALILLDGGFSWRQITVMTALSVVGCAMIYLVAPPILPEETETHGWLLPANDPTPTSYCGEMGGLTVIAGQNAFVSTMSGKFVALIVDSCPVLCVDRGESGVQIDADVFDDQGNLSARVENNEFHLIPGQVSYQKRPDRSTLIAYDRQGKELLRIRYLNPKVLQIRGVFTCKGSKPVTITDDRIILPGDRPGAPSSAYGNCNINSPIPIITDGVHRPLPRTCPK